MKTILFLGSGNGGTLKFVSEAIKKHNLDLKIIAVVSDRECKALEYAKFCQINYHKLKIKRDEQNELREVILKYSPDVVITNIHKILHENVISIKGTTFINLHYSLLPAYAGLIGMDTVEKAKKDNACFIGATTHLVIKEVDKGTILGQCITPTNWDVSSPKDYYEIIFKGGCLILLEQLTSLIENKSEKEYYKNYRNLEFNPSLSFNPNIFDVPFWDKISNL